MSTLSVFSDFLNSIAERGLGLIERGLLSPDLEPVDRVTSLCQHLMTSSGEASGLAYATEILDSYGHLSAEEKLGFFGQLLDLFGPDQERLQDLAASYAELPTAELAAEMFLASEPRRQELIRRLNQAPDATAKLVAMRRDLLDAMRTEPGLAVVDTDFAHLFGSWFNHGFLELQSIDWYTPALLLERIIDYEAVHAIEDWADLRRRIDPEDRRLYAFFHPRLRNEPLIFVEVALTEVMPSNIGDVLSIERSLLDPKEAKTAVFYSISNCQEGLRGISFGNFLIKQVVEELSRELPNLKTFVTLSPMPRFASWLAEQESEMSDSDLAALSVLSESQNTADDPLPDSLQPVMTHWATRYLIEAKNADGRVLDPVARFHLANGATLERLNYRADLSDNGLRQSHGMMVNYRYDLDEIERNHEAFVGSGMIVTSSSMKRNISKRSPRARANSRHELQSL